MSQPANDITLNITHNRRQPKFRQVVYGFYGISENDGLGGKEAQWAMSPIHPFQPYYILLWPLEPTYIDRLQVDGEEQLTHPISADTWKSDSSLDLMIDRYFDGKTAHQITGIEYLTGQEMDSGAHGSWIDIPTVNINGRLAMEWNGKLRGLLVIGLEPSE